MERADINDSKIGMLPFTTEAYLRDFTGNIPLTTLGNYLLHVATNHAQSRGFGYEDLADNQAAWVLSKMAIEVFKPLTSMEPISILTWIEDVQNITTTRCFEIQDYQRETLGYARSIWAAINTATRRPVLLSKESIEPYMSDRPCPIANPGKIAVAEKDNQAMKQFEVQYSDLDINGHLNSIKYIEHMLNLFPLDRHQEQYISRFEIAYHAEGKYGMPLDLFLKEIAPNHHIVSFTHQGKAICRCSAQWSKQ